MAWHTEKEANGDTAIVWDGFEKGIADAPEKGIAFMRNVNLISIPGEAPVNFKTSAVTIPTTQVTAASCTFTGATDIVTWTPGTVTLNNGDAVTFGSSTGGVTAGSIYWVSNVSGSTFKVNDNIGRSVITNLTDASNTFTVIAFGRATYKAVDEVSGYVFFLDVNGRVWWINTSSILTYIGNTTLTSANGNGICVLGDFLYVFRDAKIDYLPITQLTANNAPAWVYGWQDVSSTAIHFAIAAQDNGMYFCNAQTVGSVLATGGTNVDPSNAATYTYNASALLLPRNDRSTCLAELGTYLLVGGILNRVYPWDRLSTSFNSPLILAEKYTTRMVSSNSSTYIFAGNRGRIYITNGANVDIFKKVPDHITTTIEPYFTWLDALFWKNQVFFSFSITTNAGVAITTMGGVWAFDVSASSNQATGDVALRMTNTINGGSAFYPQAIAPNVRTSTPAGSGLYIAWSSALSAAYGVDITSSTPYDDYTGGIGGEIYGDLTPTGTALSAQTFTQLEFKLAQPLVSGEAVRISGRQNYSEAFTVIGTTTTVGAISAAYPMTIEKGQWFQWYAELQSTASSPSFVRLKEVRLRK